MGDRCSRIGIVFMIAAAMGLLATAVGAQMLDIPRGKGEYCVEPTDVMRKNHMDFLLHQRDLTVTQGIRTSKHSLVECIDCHVQTNQQGRFIPIDAPQQFCAVCHEFASVKLDCFECHATTPDEPAAALQSQSPHQHNGDNAEILADAIRQHLQLSTSNP